MIHSSSPKTVQIRKGQRLVVPCLFTCQERDDLPLHHQVLLLIDCSKGIVRSRRQAAGDTLTKFSQNQVGLQGV